MPTNAPSTPVRDPIAPQSSNAIWRTWLPITLFGVLWIDLFRLLSTQWETREQYGYGWFVPFFAAYLFWRRWMDRPAPCSEVRSQKSDVSLQPTACSLQAPSPDVRCQPSASGLQPPASLLPAPRCLLLALFIFLLCLALLPLRVIYEINPDWPLISWIYTTMVVGITLYAILLAGGWSWVRHFAFPVALILVAVVWPWRIEKGLTQNLMQVVANLTVEILGWLNIPAEQQGNLIALSTGTVGIDEACSGIRSFQSSLMAALVIGELYRLRLLPRLGFLVCGPGLAFVFNVIRTLLLSWQADKHGLSAIDKWHDPAGMIITVACFFVLWAVAGLLQSKWGTAERRGEAREARPEARDQTSEDRGQRPQVSLQPTAYSLQAPSPDVRDQPSASGLQSPASSISAFNFLLSAFRPSFTVHRSPFTVHHYLFAIGLWSLLCIGATEAWYRSHAIKDEGVFHWSVTMPESKSSFQKVIMAPRTAKLIKADLASTGKWQEGDGTDWTAYFFRWQPRSIQSVITSRIHRPERCLPASGLRQVGDSKPVVFDVPGLKLPFRAYTYEAEGRTLHVFFCQWEDGAEQQNGMGSSGQEDRLKSVLTGRRVLGQQSLEFIITGYPTLDEATQALRIQLPSLILFESKK